MENQNSLSTPMEETENHQLPLRVEEIQNPESGILIPKIITKDKKQPTAYQKMHFGGLNKEINKRSKNF